MRSELASKEAAVERVNNLLQSGTERFLLGIMGKPGSGKSTFTKYLKNKSNRDLVSIVPMDGFHLSNRILKELGRSDRKGAPDTFDVEGFVALLRRIRSESESDIYYPVFNRSMEESIAAQGVITPKTRLVIVEGNYLLHDQSGWEQVRELLHETWMIDIDNDKRIARLISRHVSFGRDPESAKLWAKGSDEANANLIEGSAHKADFIVRSD
jgi:pantothenate kinase